MRDFLRELFALPKYKIWNIFLLYTLACLSDLLIRNYDDYTHYHSISRDFYAIHAYAYVGLTILCMLLLLINRFRGRKSWYFLGILWFDFIMIVTLFMSEGDYPHHWLSTLPIIYLSIIVLNELIRLRRVRLNIKPSRWDIAMKIVFLIYIIKACGTMPLLINY